jgi:4-alpha-glucanotransferase
MDLFAQAKAQGIQTEFLDGQGHRRVTDAAALKIILDALPPQAPGPLVGQPVVVAPGGRREPNSRLQPGFRWRGKSLRIQALSPRARARITPSTGPGPAAGVYRLQVSDAATAEDVPLISAPERAFGGEFDRCWLLAVQLYGVRSARNWGMGDFTDLASLIELADHLGADGDRPQSAACPVRRSPGRLQPLFAEQPAVSQRALYRRRKASRISARFRNKRGAGAVAGRRCRRLRRRRRPEVAGARSAFAAFKANAKPGRQQDFDKFRAERGTLLSHFACFEALRHKFGKPWWEWPEEWRQPDDARCAALRQGEDAGEIEFVEFVQWTADRQLGRPPIWRSSSA